MATDLKVLHRGGRSDVCRALQAATNRRLAQRSLGELRVKEDGVLGQDTLEAVRKAGWSLGAKTYDRVTREGEVSVGIQRMIRNPGARTEAQKRLGKARVSRMRQQRARRAKEAKSNPRIRTVNAALARVGTREQPSGSNGGPWINTIQGRFGFGRVPWCGCFVGYFAETVGGLDVASDVASVLAIERHARAGHNPYGRWQASVKGALPGSFVVIGRSGMHVAMLVQALPDGSAITVEGNTSFGPGGSQSNGGCVARRYRSDGEIVGVATMDYGS